MADEAAAGDRGTVIGQGLAWSARWSVRLLLTAAGVTLIGVLVAQLWSIVFPVLMAVLVATVLWPPAAWLRRHRFPPAAASAVVLLVGLGILAGLITLVGTSVSGSVSDIAANVSAGIEAIGAWLSGPPFNLGRSQLDTVVQTVTDRLQSSVSVIATNVLATVGSFASGLVTTLLTLVLAFLAVLVALVSNGFTAAVIVLVIVLAVQQIEGNVLQPVLQSRSLGLHAAVVLLAVTAGSTLYGIAGAFLSVPVTAAAAVVLRYLGELVDERTGPPRSGAGPAGADVDGAGPDGTPDEHTAPRDGAGSDPPASAAQPG